MIHLSPTYIDILAIELRWVFILIIGLKNLFIIMIVSQ